MPIIFKVLLKESLPAIISSISITGINLVSYTAMAGAVGGGGLGDIAIRYGYYRYETTIMIITVIIIVLLVQLFQYLGNTLAIKLDKRKR